MADNSECGTGCDFDRWGRCFRHGTQMTGFGADIYDDEPEDKTRAEREAFPVPKRVIARHVEVLREAMSSWWARDGGNIETTCVGCGQSPAPYRDEDGLPKCALCVKCAHCGRARFIDCDCWEEVV